MKKHIQKLAALAVIMTVSAIFVSAKSMAAPSLSMQIEVPFEFQVGEETYAAGDYRIKTVKQNLLVIESLDNDSDGVVLGSIDAEIGGAFNSYKLSFNTYGDKHFLRAVSGPSVKFLIAESKSEKEAGKGETAQLTNLIFR